MYAGSFAASLKGIACTRGFVILLACASTIDKAYNVRRKFCSFP
nr:MAG TPA: hypothetical protein [Caudoviricetes sp.]